MSKSKFDSSFPDSQFSIPGYRINRRDQNERGGEILFYINKGMSFSPVSTVWGWGWG